MDELLLWIFRAAPVPRTTIFHWALKDHLYIDLWLCNVGFRETGIKHKFPAEFIKVLYLFIVYFTH